VLACRVENLSGLMTVPGMSGTFGCFMLATVGVLEKRATLFFFRRLKRVGKLVLVRESSIVCLNVREFL